MSRPTLSLEFTAMEPPVQEEVALFSSTTLCLIANPVMSSKPKQSRPELNFEGAMDRLEAIVEQMESGKLALEELIVRYEEGMNLVKVCQERLASAEQKIEIIARNSAGKTFVKNFEPTPEIASPAKTVDKAESKNDEVRLF
jgi:exodeoxyribonuclease VII small subunit